LHRQDRQPYGLQTEATEALRALCVEALKAAEGTERFVLVAAPPRCELPVRGAFEASFMSTAPLHVQESSFDEAHRDLI
jgi:hypothetical protein